MIHEVIERVLAEHDDFSYEEIQEICEDFWNNIPKKIKDSTKLKRLHKFVETEFELGGHQMEKDVLYKQYSLDGIPKYLFEGTSNIKSSLIHIKNMDKNIEQTHLFQDAELQIGPKDKIALIGKNGCGKTTLLKMIIGKEENLDGIIEMAPNIKIGYLSQDLFWSSSKNTLAEEMFQIFPEINQQIIRLDQIEDSIDDWEEKENLTKALLEVDGFKKYALQGDILKYFGFSDEQMTYNVLQLSGGEQTKVQIAKFLIQEVDILILDEPTNHLDIEGIIFLEKFCQTWKKALLSISHDIRFINNTSEKIAEISHKKINNYPGNYDLYLAEKQVRFDTQMKSFSNQQREIEKQNDYINRFRANSAKASSVQSRIKALAKVEVLTKPEIETVGKMMSINSDKRLPEVIIKINNLQVGYHHPIVHFPAEVEVHKSDKIGIIGSNGCGKTTLLKTILGEMPALDGSSKINETIIVGSYSQVLADLNMESSILEELAKNYDNQKDVRTILGGLLITGDKVDQKIGTLSGGERAKVALTKMLLVKPHIIIMDEPTNHLDLHSKEVIKQMLKGFNGTTLVVSHDRDLLESISNKIWLIKGQMLATYDEPEKGFAEVFGD